MVGSFAQRWGEAALKQAASLRPPPRSEARRLLE